MREALQGLIDPPGAAIASLVTMGPCSLVPATLSDVLMPSCRDAQHMCVCGNFRG